MNQAEERIFKLEDSTFAIQSKENKKKRKEKSEKSLHDPWNISKRNKVLIIWVQEAEQT